METNMFKALIGTVAAGVIAAGAFAIAPAQAAEFGVYVGPTYHQHSCRHWSERLQGWVWTCQRPYQTQYYHQAPSFSLQFGDRERHHHDYENQY